MELNFSRLVPGKRLSIEIPYYFLLEALNEPIC